MRERGNYGDQAEAENVTRAVLGVLAGRLAGGEAEHLAAQLPSSYAELFGKPERA